MQRQYYYTNNLMYLLITLILISIIDNLNKLMHFNVVLSAYIKWNYEHNTYENMNNKAPNTNDLKKYKNNTKIIKYKDRGRDRDKKRKNNSNENILLIGDSNCTRYGKNKCMEIPCEIPVLLTKTQIQTSLKYVLNFNEPVMEIKNIKNDVFLNENTIINIYEDPLYVYKAKISISGFVRKTIDYSSIETIKDNYIKNSIKNIILKVPFKCDFLVNYIISPQLYNNKRIFCSIDEAEVLEFINKSLELPSSTKKVNNKYLFSEDTLLQDPLIKSIESKMILKLNLSLFQKQRVNIK